MALPAAARGAGIGAATGAVAGALSGPKDQPLRRRVGRGVLGGMAGAGVGFGAHGAVRAAGFKRLGYGTASAADEGLLGARRLSEAKAVNKAHQAAKVKVDQSRKAVVENLKTKNRFSGMEPGAAKKQYYREAMKAHPDRGGDQATFTRLNEEWKTFQSGLKAPTPKVTRPAPLLTAKTAMWVELQKLMMRAR